MADGNESQNQNACCSAEACNGEVKEKDNNAEVNSSEINPSNENTTEPKSSATKKNKKKKKKKLGGEEGDNVDGTLATGEEPSTSTSDASAIKPNMMDINRFMQQLSLAKGKTEVFSEEEKKSFVFWETQPVPKMDEVVPMDTNQAVEENPDEIRKEPFTLPTGFVWDNVLLNEESQLSELYTLLNENYVEDDDNMFRFDYSPEFLKWALQPPGWKSQWHCGVRVASNKKLVGFISAIPAKIKVYDKAVEMVEINFLCVHKKLRAKRVAPVLIREITRRVNVEGVFQAVYTAGIVLPKPVGTCRYWHRSINPKKLIEVKFSHLRKNMTMQRTIKLYKLPESTKTALVPLTEADLQSGYKLVSEYLSKFNLAPILTEEEFSHWFLPRKDVIACYAIKDRDTGAVTDLVSFYQLPSTVVDHPKYSSLKAAYSYYNVASSTDITTLMNDALILARDEGYDVFNALNLMENSQFLEKLKFGIGDGNLNYYLYNWKCPTITTEKVGLVLQ